DRPVLAVALRGEPARLDAVPDEVVLDRGGAGLAEALVVLAPARVVGVALDLDELDVGVAAEHVGDLLEERARLAEDLRRVRLEEDLVRDADLVALDLHALRLRALVEREGRAGLLAGL